MASNIQFKRGTAAALYAANPVLLRGEPGLEIDTNKIKYGNGVTPWRDLPYGNPALEVVDGGAFLAPAVPAVPGVFSPPTLSGLVLWLDANEAEYTHKVNNRLSLWEDMSETRAQFFQSNKANRPSMVNQIAEEDVITFDGTNDALLGNFTLPAEFTLLVALRRRGSSTNGKLITAYSANGTAEIVLCGTETGGSVGVSDGEDYYATQPIDDLVPVIYTLQFSEDGFSTRLNGLNTQADEAWSVAAKTIMSIGGDRADFAADNFSGDIAEIVMYDRILTAPELLDVETYMMERRGISQVVHPLLEGMKAFWPLNEETGNRIDITDAEVPLTPTGDVGFEAGVIGNAANFTGGANYLQAPADFTLSGAFSVSLWFKPAAVTGSVSQIIQNWAGGMQGQMVLGFGDEFMGDPGEVWAYIRTSDDNYRVGTPLSDPNRWYHVALVFDQTGNKLLLYVDGALADQAITAGTLATSTIPLRVGVGEQTTAPNTVAFLADQLGIWDRALSATDVEMLYNDELGKEDFTADLYGDNVSLLLHMDKPANAVGGSGGGSLDPYFNDVALLLHMNGPGFTDSSANAVQITNLDATISTTQSKFGGASGYFDGSNAYLTAPFSSAFEFGTGDFTVEGWIYWNGPAQGPLIAAGAGWNGSGPWHAWGLSARAGENIVYWSRIDERGDFYSFTISAAYTFNLNQWYHIAVSRTGTTTKIFIDGIEVASGADTNNYTAIGSGNNNDIHIGYWYTGLGDQYHNGHIDEIRVTKGVARYTANFTPPTAEFPDSGAPTDPNFSDVTLLLNLNGPGITDSSLKAHQITNNGATISTAQSKFGGASAYFDGASELTVPYNAELEFGVGDFTVEAWIYLTSLPEDGFIASPANDSGWFFGAWLSANGALGFGRKMVAWDLVDSNPVPLNTWVHVAAARESGTLRLFVDGVKVQEAPNTFDYNLANGDLILGSHGASLYLNGYIDDFRITKGVARYTANFTPPTAEFPLGPIKTVTMPTVETALLLHMDGANASTAFIDSGENAFTFTANNTAAISTLQSKFGGSSLMLDGNYGFLSAPHNNTLVFDGDFTVELFAYFNATPTAIFSFCGVWDQNPNYSWLFACVPEGLRLYWSNDGQNGGQETVAWTPSVGEWYHIAVCRAGNIVRFFVDGVQVGADTPTTATYKQSSAPVTVGSAGSDGHHFGGYIDELRITKGAALYQTNFTAPTAPFPDPQPSPALLVNFDNGITDLSANAHTITNNGGVIAELPTPVAAGFENAGVFNGTNSYLVIPDAPEFDLSSGPFCIELRFLVTAPGQDINTDAKVLISKDQYGVSYSWGIQIAAEAIRVATANIAGDWDFLVSQIISSNEWHHIALTGDGSTMKLFYDGVLVGTKNRTLTNAPADITIGCQSYNSPNAHFPGYIDNVRIVKGAQVYTSNFTPPTASLLPPAGTPAPDLLLHFDGPTFIDHGKNQLTATATGGAFISNTQSKFGGAAGYFDGVAAHVSIEDAGQLDFTAADDFCIEGWIYFNDVTEGAPLISKGTNTSSGGWTVYVYQNTFYFGRPYIDNIINATTTLAANTWYHVAVTRENGMLRLFLNGVQEASAANSAPFSASGWPVLIGKSHSNSYLDGHVDEVRVVKGHAIYTANFTPPVAPFQNPIITLTQPATGLGNGLEAFWKFDDLTDSTGNGHDLVDVGYTTITPGLVGGALTFDANSGLQYAKISNFRFLRAAGFSISGWIKSADPNQISGPFALSQGIPFSFCNGSMVTLEYGVFNAGNNPCFGPTSTAIQILNPAGWQGSLDGNWHHLVGTFDGNTGKFYVDGVLIGEQTGVTMSDEWPVPDAYFGSGMAEYARTGQVDSVAYWTRALTESEVLALYNNGNGTETLTSSGGGAGPITTFIDSSKHNHELTAVGNAYLNLEDIKYGSGSGEFAGGHCTIPMSPEFAFGTGDFTVEFWGNLNYAANSAVFSIAPTSQEAGTYLIGFRNDPNMFGFCYDMPNFTFVSADISAYYAEWAHYAFVRLDGVLKMYVNGAQVGTANTTIDLDGGTQTTAVIGRRWVDVDDHYLAGLIDDLRITKGVARYIANFNPPTKAFPDPVLVAPPAPTGDIYAENVTLLLHMDGANGSTTFTDNSYLQNTVTAEGAVISTAQSKFGGSSAYFNGAEELMVPPELTEIPAGTDFTIEAWVYITNQSTNGIIGTSTLSGLVFYVYSDGALTVDRANQGGGVSSSANAVTLNAWHHVAVSRAGTVARLFVNGVKVGEGPLNYSFPLPEALSVGHMAGEAMWWFNGYIDDLRITKGVARYTSDFVPPTEAFPNPFTATSPAALLLHFDGPDNSTTFTDSSANSVTVSPLNGAVISTAQSKFGGASGYFTGYGAALDVTNLPAGYLDGDFTIETWVFLTDPSQQNQTIFNTTPHNTLCISLNRDNTGLTHVFIGNGNTWLTSINSTTPITFNAWQHIALVRSGSTVTLYENGTAAATSNIVPSGASTAASISTISLFSGEHIKGYLDEYRISSTAVYTANFTPPTAPFSTALTPADITGCDLWLDSTGDIAESNGAILTWADKSGNGRTATPADYAPAPIVAAGDGPNGQDVVRFSGDPNVLDVSYQFNLKNSSGFILLKQPEPFTAPSGYQRVLSFQPETGFDFDQTDGLTLALNNVSTAGIEIHCVGPVCSYATPFPFGWTLIAYSIDASGNVTLRVDGEQVATGTNSSMAANAGGNLYIGHGGALFNEEALTGDIAEISLFDHALGEAALIGLERGIMQRWFPPSVVPPIGGGRASLLMKFDDNFNDSSVNNVSVTNNGVTIDTITTKFGSGSAFFNGSQVNTLTVADSPAFGFGTGDFTIEMFVKQQSATRNSVLSIGTYQDGILWRLAPYITDSLYLAYNAPGGNAWDWDATASVPLDTWTHIALTRQNGTLRAFIDGVKVFEQTGVTVDLGESRPLTIGCGAHELQPVDAYYGFIDELRIIKGAAVYTDNFTPPTQPFPSWGDVIGSSYGANIVAAYDFTELNTTTNVVPAIIGPEMLAFGLTRDAYGAVFAADGFSGTYAESTISVNYPHTIVMVARLDIATIFECNLMAVWESASFASPPVVSLFSRTMNSGILPYNGQDGQQVNFMPNSAEFAFIAASFLNDGTVRVAVRSQSGDVDIVLSAPNGQANFNGYPSVGPWFGDLTRGYSPVGTYRLTMYINQGFATVAEMDALFADIAAGPASDITF